MKPRRTPASAPQHIGLGEGAWLEWWPGFLASEERPDAGALARELPLRADTFTLFGRTMAVPRLIAWHGDPGCRYRYSGQTYEPAPWTRTLARLRETLARRTGIAFNGVLANYYRDGRDSMGWHADDERELGPSPDDIAVASLSFGAPRRFVLRHRESRERRAFPLGDGALLVMRGATQRNWQHALPKTRQPVGPRLNLTFRVVRPSADADPGAA